MSDPQRYSLSEPDISYGMDENNKGEYVLWKDYARLKAEVERLRKAGDAMYGELLICGDRMEFMGGMTRGMVGWNATKEGKPSV